ncbi:POU domain, class 2, transcription factor 3 [Orchesella cincta]|uniref:POU domain, class 2, transcription factor 3 n=1 Tax=Orchesella cincta TaxID=48709 RepID=A0A1D2MU31_ORCCI|nr:POU domain, class 2, transcription factor 3 [Orchesella cincta]
MVMDSTPDSIPQPSSLITPPPNIEPPIDETMDLDELEQFAHAFSKRRIKLGFTQKDVGIGMKKLEANYVSQTTISRFEALNMSFNNMCKLKPLLERWLVEEENSLKNSQPAKKAIGGKRKKRTIIDKTVVSKLEWSFRKNPMPMVEDIAVLADKLGMDKKVVQVWFYNR